MKLIFGIFLILLSGIFFLISLKRPPVVKIDSSISFSTVTPYPTSIPRVQEKMKDLTIEGSKYRYAIREIETSEDLKLFSNLTDKSSSLELKEDNNCSFLTNGGFYGKDDRPLGWFVSESQQVRGIVQNKLIDGIIFQTLDNQIDIEFANVKSDVNWGLQTGPMLIIEGQPLDLKIRNDERARRMVAAKFVDGKIVFLAITDDESLISGPLLADLPQVILTIAKSNNLVFQKAINLDGGSASAFLDKNIQINEYTWIGSYFCLTN